MSVKTSGRHQTLFDGEPGHPVGVCHLPLEPAYCDLTRQVIFEAIIVAIEGPRFSSKAESNIYRMWGGDVINMTSVPEVILAKEAGICYVSIALTTDYDCWRETGEKVCVADVLRTS
ncbi:hypothetical protein NQ317_018371 [Molorchus minor]|uniref:Nucleoside phosphorylase domain-containing protein n=1 Tax=Molorchus minor TaxID=1323400 RepID=A0ABQ9J0J1_9CUCU|nr:hypothetical protein NQ317_018371 [Molorchus minor]